MLTEKQLLTATPALRRYAWSLAREGWEDLLQDTLCRGWQKRELFLDGDAQAWLMTIMHNQHANNLRKARREIGKTSDEAQVTPEAQSAHVFAVEVKDAIERLPSIQQEVLIFAAIHGEEYVNAAEMFGVPIGTIRSRLFRGRNKLRKQFV